MKKLILLLSLFLSINFIYSQDSTKQKSKIDITGGSDFVSKNVWRGALLDNNINIQPWVSFNYKGFEIGAFGSSSINNYNEVDSYLGYCLDNFKFKVIDYFIPLDLYSTDYFNFKDDSTGYHNITIDFIIGGGEDMPLQAIFSTYVYGYLDRGSYSTYMELKYKINKMDFYIGYMDQKSDFFIVDKPGFINTGITYHYLFGENKIPFNSSFIVNPVMKKVYITFAISL
jgi:hypothetical protein